MSGMEMQSGLSQYEARKLADKLQLKLDAIAEKERELAEQRKDPELATLRAALQKFPDLLPSQEQVRNPRLLYLEAEFDDVLSKKKSTKQEQLDAVEAIAVGVVVFYASRLKHEEWRHGRDQSWRDVLDEDPLWKKITAFWGTTLPIGSTITYNLLTIADVDDRIKTAKAKLK